MQKSLCFGIAENLLMQTTQLSLWMSIISSRSLASFWFALGCFPFWLYLPQVRRQILDLILCTLSSSVPLYPAVLSHISRHSFPGGMLADDCLFVAEASLILLSFWLVGECRKITYCV